MKDFTEARYRNNKNNDFNTYYLTDFSRITPDGLLYMNYRKEKYGTSSNPDTVELCWEKDTVFLDNMNDIDEKFNNYCNKINPIIEEIKIKKENKIF